MEWTQWMPFTPSTVNRAPKYQGVYELALVGRRQEYPYGWSNIIYIGEAHSDESSIHARLSAHHSGNGDPTIRAMFGRREPLKVRWAAARDPQKSERTLLCRFEERFRSLPLGNGRL